MSCDSLRLSSAVLEIEQDRVIVLAQMKQNPSKNDKR